MAALHHDDPGDDVGQRCQLGAQQLYALPGAWSPSTNGVIRGKVVKFTPGVMGKNWLHVRDGSGDVLAETIGLLIGSGVLMALFLLVENRSKSALVPLTFFRNRTASGAKRRLNPIMSIRACCPT